MRSNPKYLTEFMIHFIAWWNSTETFKFTAHNKKKFQSGDLRLKKEMHNFHTVSGAFQHDRDRNYVNKSLKGPLGCKIAKRDSKTKVCLFFFCFFTTSCF